MMFILELAWVKTTMYLNFASRQFGADVRRQGCRHIGIFQTLANKANAPKSRDYFVLRVEAFLFLAF